MSNIRYVAEEAKALIDPLPAGTRAMFEVICPSSAFKVDAYGCV